MVGDYEEIRTGILQMGVRIIKKTRLREAPMDRKNKILVAEDDLDTCCALATLLTHVGFEVISVTDGQQAYKSALLENPDLIITDINMPGLNGLDFIRLLKSDSRLSSIPIIAMSAIDLHQLHTAIQLGAIAVFNKPLEFEAFFTDINLILAHRNKYNKVSHATGNFK